MIWVSFDIIESEISPAPLPHFRIQVIWYRRVRVFTTWEGFRFDQLGEVLFLTSNYREFEYRVQGDNICRDQERLGMGGHVLGKPMCEGTAVFKRGLLWLENKGSCQFHYYEAITLSRHEVESAYLRSF